MNILTFTYTKAPDSVSERVLVVSAEPNKMYKGTAAKAMQTAYARYGEPTGLILVECHEDHIDVVEASLIARHKPTLNSDRPKDPFPDMDIDSLCILFTTFVHSARDIVEMKEQQEHKATLKQKSLIQNIAELETEIECLKEEACVLTDEADRLLKRRSKEEINADISGRISTLEARLHDQSLKTDRVEKERNNLSKELECKVLELEYANRPWWKKMFS